MKILESRRNSSSVRESSDQVGNLIKPLTRECTGIFLHNWESMYSTTRYTVKKVTVALTETFPLLRALLNLLKESLGLSKPANNLNTSTITHCVGFLRYPSLTEPSSIE